VERARVVTTNTISHPSNSIDVIPALAREILKEASAG
jgi:hypothetical protein